MAGVGASSDVLAIAGSNVDKEWALPEAIVRLRRHPQLSVRAVSEPFESASVGGPPDAPYFHNVAIRFAAELGPELLRDELRGIEYEMGRRRGSDPNEPRIIDLDIIYYGDLVRGFGDWSIPDPDVLRYPYLAVPIAEIAPEWLHPVTGQSAFSIAKALTSDGGTG
jgi:2-amino-4-hydroxy-6-hydroxymethyldihydropteridine diphosphokinase